MKKDNDDGCRLDIILALVSYIESWAKPSFGDKHYFPNGGGSNVVSVAVVAFFDVIYGDYSPS
ncbi:hypothetical protein [Brenneria corticis]|uniref:hypothetical protein n=1 Tax=Brenneria corticis TaxID=2173106 RepID=UPI00109E11F0|nr:hypothetical protein [Brenneria sp. CFCC 11842]